MNSILSLRETLYLALILLLGSSAAFAQGLPNEFTSGTPAKAAEVTANFRYLAPKNMVFVSPVDGGTATDNGTALLAALDLTSLTAINGAPSAANPYLIKLTPGVYDLGALTLNMLSYVNIEGSGKGLVHDPGSGYVAEGGSKITSSGGTTVIGAANSEIRSLLVENTNTTASIGISIAADPFRIEQVTVFGSCFSSGGSQAGGINITGSSPEIESVAVFAVAGPTNCYGVRISGASSPVLNQVHVSALNQGFCFGVMNYSSDPVGPRFTNVTFTATGCSVTNVALFNNGASATVYNGILSAGSGSNWQTAVYNTAAQGTVTIHHSALSGPNSIQNAALYTVNVAASQLAGTIVDFDGTDEFHCASVYDATFVDITASCDAL